MIRPIKYLILTLLCVACATEPTKTKNSVNSGVSVGQGDPSLLEQANIDGANENSKKNEEAEEVAVPVPESVSKKDTSAAEEKFKNVVNSTREDLLIQYGSEILAQKPDDIKTLNGFAQFYIRANQPDLARIYLNRVIAKDPKNADANNSLGVLAIKDGKEADAQVFFKRALQDDDNQPEANANLGTYYLKYLDYDKAAMFLQKAYDHDHKNVTVANNYAIALRGLNKYDDALSIYKSIESKSKVQVLLNEAILLSEYKKDFKEAKDILNKIRFISSDPAIIKKVNVLLTLIDQQNGDKKN